MEETGTVKVKEKKAKASQEQVVRDEDQYVTFQIKNELYGIIALKVQEIIGMPKITAMPNTLPFMKGIINLRGMVIPAIDMRTKFNMEEIEYTLFTVIIIVEVQERLVGMIVDAVSDVLNIAVEEIQEKPQFSSEVDVDYIMGIGKKEEEVVLIIDIERIMTTEELEIIDKA